MKKSSQVPLVPEWKGHAEILDESTVLVLNMKMTIIKTRILGKEKQED